MSETKTTDDPLDERWACLVCFWLGRFGELMAKDVLRCPRCNSGNIHPADPTTRPFGIAEDLG